MAVMSTKTTPPPPAPDWVAPSQCPFCEAALADPGAGFMEHLRENPTCERGFEQWRNNVADDMRGEWGG
ncbi:Uncharacterized protein AArcCO_0709 [Halalkaliarchaeum sp. AArc-CO]|nr:Uncharacterized protein AArcCO_0709 [Halalkaliarchaeum sp. AArc-CO]